MVCAGWKGKVNIEDSLFAGAVIEKLKDDFESACDAPLMVQHLYNQAKHDLAGFLANSSHVKRLAKLNVYKDIGFCVNIDQYMVLPILRDGVLINIEEPVG